MIWLDKTATVRNQQHFDDVGQRKYYVDMFRLQAPSVSAPLSPEPPLLYKYFDSVGPKQCYASTYRLQAPLVSASDTLFC